MYILNSNRLTMKRTVALTMILSVLSGIMQGQQLMPTTQYLQNKLTLNPAYAGATEDVSIVGLYRNQWVGIKGQPIQYIANLSMPIFNTNSNIGFNVNLDKIGPISLYDIFANYAYKIRLTEDKSLRLGIRGGFSHGVVNQTALEGFYNGDPSFSATNVFFNKPTVGLGVYYESKNLAFSASVPNLIMSGLDFTADKNIFRNTFQAFIGGEYIFRISEYFALKPALFARYSANTPVNYDVNLYGIINKFLWIGGGRRSSDTYMANVQFIINEILFPRMINEIRIGYAYDFSNSTYGSVTNGSHEILIGYSLIRNRSKDIQSVSPRYF